MKEAIRKPVNTSKLAEVVQEPTESPGAFLEQVMDTYRQYAGMDPTDPGNACLVNLTFVSQSYHDIKKEVTETGRSFWDEYKSAS